MKCKELVFSTVFFLSSRSSKWVPMRHAGKAWKAANRRDSELRCRVCLPLSLNVLLVEVYFSCAWFSGFCYPILSHIFLSYLPYPILSQPVLYYASLPCHAMLCYVIIYRILSCPFFILFYPVAYRYHTMCFEFEAHVFVAPFLWLHEIILVR